MSPAHHLLTMPGAVAWQYLDGPQSIGLYCFHCHGWNEVDAFEGTQVVTITCAKCARKSTGIIERRGDSITSSPVMRGMKI